ncbi:MAG: histidine phosphatase family protein [Candidatus Entotheonellia bacterium]
MDTTRIILVRHGETDWNAAGRIQGHSDTPLNAAGRQQAQRVGVRLASEPVRAVYSSDLARAYETATIIGQALRLDVFTSSQLRERLYGSWEGLTWSEIQARYPRELVEYERRHRPMDFAPPGGETRSQLLNRALTTLQTIARRHPGQTVVAVTHGGLCYVVLVHLMGSIEGDGRRFSPANGSLHILEAAGDRWAVISINETAHLQMIDP